ncbi:MAG: TetR/AcrR family transcriptional regulator [Oricola sp.]
MLSIEAKLQSDQTVLRDSLLGTARDMFSERGFSGTSIRDIANAHGVSVSNIYHHFGSKEGLWREILKQSVRMLPARLRDSANSADGPADQLRTVVREHLRAALEHKREQLMVLIEQERLGEGSASDNREIQREVLKVYTDILERMSAEGLLQSAHPRITAFNILGVINWHLRWFRADGPLDTETVHREILDFILRGACREC